MGSAICFKCGIAKSSAFDACRRCGATPSTNSEQAVSLALSNHLSLQTQLAQYSQSLGKGEKVSVPREVLVRALNALKDPQFRGMLESQSSNSSSSVPTSPPDNSMPDIQADTHNAPLRPPPRSLPGSSAATKLDGSPFTLLGATTRDNRRRIVELADEKSLDLAPDVCQKARSDLTNPRTRLGVELAWLPGVSPRRVHDLMETLHQEPTAARGQTGLPILAQLNLEAAVFESLRDAPSADDMAHFVAEFSSLVEDLDSEDVLRDVNEDRLVSGFPQISGVEQVESELADRKRYYRNSIKHALDRLPTQTLIRVMTSAVDDATSNGTEQAPSLIDDLVDSYEAETQGFLQKEAENAQKLVKATRDAAAQGEAAVKPYVDKLDMVARNWDRVAQPIQLSAKARGTDHGSSRELAHSIRSLAIDLCNDYDMLMQAQRLTALLQELFQEIPDISDKLREDADALARLSALEPFQALCKRVRGDVERSPNSANNEGQRLLSDGQALLRKLPANLDGAVQNEAKDMVAQALMECAIAYGNKTSIWTPCVTLLESALGLASDQDVRKRINDNLAIVRNNLTSLGGLEPVQSAPSLRTVNGIGVKLYGEADRRQSDNSYIATYYFVVFFIPIIPIARYRVIPTNGGYRFLAKGSIDSTDIWRSVISIGLVIIGLMILSSL